jgi:tetratricopeptide (TPR) repeat protein
MNRAVRRCRVPATRGLAAIVICLGLALFAAGCGGRAEPPEPADAAERAQLLIESGNRAYGTGNYGLAARRYAAAAVIREDDPAAYYGLGMALSKLGRDEDARAAYARARELSRR